MKNFGLVNESLECLIRINNYSINCIDYSIRLDKVKVFSENYDFLLVLFLFSNFNICLMDKVREENDHSTPFRSLNSRKVNINLLLCR